MTDIHPIQLHAQPYEVKLNLNGNSYHLIFGMFFASLFCIKLQKVFVGCCTYIL